jgi:hypothetical protein
LNGFSRIGGIIALFKVGILLEWLHERWYKKQLSETAEKQGSLFQWKSIAAAASN